MNEIKVSVCIITFNQEKYIRECIEGAMEQKTDFQYEIIIGDDHSLDNTSHICEEYSVKYPSLINYYRREKNLGMIGNWIETINDCSGKYIALCEGDDYWTDPLKLQKQVDFLEVNQDYSYCGHQSLILNDGELKENQVKIGDLTLEDVIKKNSLHTATLMFRKFTLVNLSNFFNGVTAADWMIQFIALNYGDAYVLEDIMSVYRKHEDGIWSQLDKSRMGQQGVDTLITAKGLFNDNEKILTLINQAIYERQNEFGLIKDSILKRIIKRLKFLIKKT